MTTAIIDTDAKIKEFAAHVQAGVDSWERAGKALVEILDADADAKGRIHQMFPKLNPVVLSRFEAIGRGSLHPGLMMAGSPGLNRLRQLPYSDQKRYIETPVEVLTPKGDTLKVKVENLTGEQAAQVFAKDSVRDLGAQKNWIEAKGKNARIAHADFKISGNKVTFMADCTFDRKKLAEILAQLV